MNLVNNIIRINLSNDSKTVYASKSDSVVSSFHIIFLGKRRLHILYYAIHFYERRYCFTFAKLLPDIFRVQMAFRVTYTHLAIWTNAPRIADRICDTIFLNECDTPGEKTGAAIFSYGHKCITAYMYKDIKAYLYVNMRMCLCVNMRTHKYVHTKTHEHIYGCVRSPHIRRDTIFTEFRG